MALQGARDKNYSMIINSLRFGNKCSGVLSRPHFRIADMGQIHQSTNAHLSNALLPKQY